MLTLADSLGWWTRRFQRTPVPEAARRPGGARRAPAARRARPSAIPAAPRARPAASPAGPCRSAERALRAGIRRRDLVRVLRRVVRQAEPLADQAAVDEDRAARRLSGPRAALRARALSLGQAELHDRVGAGAAGLLGLRAAAQRQVDRDPLVLGVDVQDGRAGVLELARQREEVRGAEQVAAVERGQPAADDARSTPRAPGPSPAAGRSGAVADRTGWSGSARRCPASCRCGRRYRSSSRRRTPPPRPSRAPTAGS